jgi:protein-S-isoprenylcysteine O-methyltransferase Ste14
MKYLQYLYAAYCYLVAAVAMLAFLLFFENFYLSKTVSLPSNIVTARAIFTDIGLLLLFGLQHSLMARDWFKKWLTHYLPASLERVTYILMSSVVLALIVWWWQPFGEMVWDVRNYGLGWLLLGLGVFGGIVVVISAGLINSRYFVGFQQIQTQTAQEEQKFVTPFFYQHVRHPIYFGTLLAIWCVPVMSASGILFCVGMTAYIIIGATYEERNLRLRFGDEYRAYQANVPMLIPFTKFRNTI